MHFLRSRRIIDGIVCYYLLMVFCFFFFFQAEDGIRDLTVTGVQTCALPISSALQITYLAFGESFGTNDHFIPVGRSEEHTSELQSQSNLVCRLLLEKKKRKRPTGCAAPRSRRSPREPRSPCSAAPSPWPPAP